MRAYLPLCILVFFYTVASAQQPTTVKGKILNEKKEPLSGVNIAVKGTTIKTVSNEDGTFSVKVVDAQTAILLFTHVSYKSQNVPVNGILNLAVSMDPADNDMKDVIVISALGLTRKANSIGYSQQSVDVNALTEARDVNIVNGLAGKVAGIQVTTTGQPGSSSRVVLRGDNSVTGNNQPLWVVDGVPIANDMGDTRGDNLDYGNGAADLNPDDIESMVVLKGPNAAALYGSRAANGAILVTTKKGKADKTLGISLNQNLMFNTITEFPLYQNVYGEGTNGQLGNATLFPGGSNAINMGSVGTSWGMPMLGQPYNTFNGQPHGYYPQPGNISTLYQTGVTNTTNISLSKADAVSSFRASYTFTKGSDVMQNQNLLTKHNVNMFASRKIGTFITVDASVLYTYQDTKNRTYRNLDPSSPMTAYVYMPRSFDAAQLSPWADPNGNAYGFGTQPNGYANPFWSINENSNEDAHNRLIGGLTTTIKFTNYLSLRARAAGDLDFLNTYQYKELGGQITPLGYYANSMTNVQNWNYEALLMFNKKINKDFTLTANLGTNNATFKSLGRGASTSSLLVHNMPSISNTNVAPATSEFLTRSKIVSVYGSATLGFRDFLFLDITGRNDWSSTLPSANNSYFYPSFSGSFIFSKFIKDKTFLSYGKVRASWAQVGNAAPPYSLINTYSFGGLFLSNPYLAYSTVLKNFDLKPEQTTSQEIGLDVTLFKDRINLSATAYQSHTLNQIIQAQTAPETGFTTRFVNAGEVKNKGIELSLNAIVLKGKDFTWNVRANWAKNVNLVASLAPGVNRLQLGSNLGATVNAVVGQPYGALWGNAPYKVGDTILVQSNGRLYVDANQNIGNFRPDWIGSLGTSLQWKGFDFSILMTVKMGGSIYSASYGRANFAGVTVASLAGRDAYLFSTTILGETGNEQQGIGQTVGTTVTRYADSARAKGLQYTNSYFPKVDPITKAIVYDKNGRMIPGAKNNTWTNPQTIASDMVLNNTPAITYDATNIKISEMIIGYTMPQKMLKRTPIKNARIALVGRNLWTIFKNTPQGIDPEAANTSGNAQGIESGGSFPYAQYGFDLKLTF